MFGSTVLDVLIGLVFVYFLLSLICSGIHETVSQWLSRRAQFLEEAIGRLLTDPNTRRQFYDHPLIKSLSKSNKGDVRPSYLAAKDFAVVVMDVVAPAVQNYADFRKNLDQIQDGALKAILLAMLDDATNDLERTRKLIEAWFDSAMDRVSGWYARNARNWLFAFAALATTLLNADTIAITEALWQQPALRQAAVAAAQGYAGQNPAMPGAGQPLAQIKAQIEATRIPLGWTSLPQTPGELFSKVLGLIVTMLAVSLGAPFWFDLLGKLANVRAAGKKPVSAG